MKNFKKLIMLVFFAIIVFTSNSDSIAQPFEGKIKFKISHEDKESFLNYFIKDDNLRIEMGFNKEAVFIKSGGKTLIVMPGKKMFMSLDNSIFNEIPGMREKIKEKTKSEKFDIDKYRTGKTKNILGYKCNQWIIKDKESEDEVEAWVTNELGNFMLMESPMSGGFSPDWGSSMENTGFFPILVISKDKNRKETSRFEATEINKQSLNNELFIPPSDFKEIKIPGMNIN